LKAAVDGRAPLPQAKGAGVILKAATTYSMNAGKSAISDGIEKGSKAAFGGEEDKTKIDEQAIRSSGTSNSTVTGTLSLLNNNVYTQEKLAELYANSDGEEFDSILNEDGSLKIDPSVAGASLTSEQQSATAALAKKLPADGYGALNGIGEKITDSYSDGYDVAHRQ